MQVKKQRFVVLYDEGRVEIADIWPIDQVKVERWSGSSGVKLKSSPLETTFAWCWVSLMRVGVEPADRKFSDFLESVRAIDKVDDDEGEEVDPAAPDFLA